MSSSLHEEEFNAIFEEMENDDHQEEQQRGQNCGPRQRNREEDELKGIKMKVPSFQGKSDPEAYLEWEKSVEEYYKELELTMTRANVVEDEEATMVRFVGGLNRDIANIVELHHYLEMDALLDKAMKVERQLRFTKFSKSGSNTSSYNKGNWSKQEAVSKPKFEPKFKTKFEVTSGKEQPASTSKGTSQTSNTHNRDIKCFKCLGKGHIASQCPNKRTMYINAMGEFESEEEEEEEMPKLEESEEEVELPESGEIMVVRRALNAQLKEEDDSQQWETIFHTRCMVKGNVCSMIIDGGSCANVVSTYLVEKLGLKTTKHLNPYRLQWLNDCGEVKVVKQVVIPFSIGKYVDETLCDVVSMHAGHLLLGRPWQFDRKAIHDGVSNRYTIELKGNKHTLVPLLPSEVHKDQKRLHKQLKEYAQEQEKKNSGVSKSERPESNESCQKTNFESKNKDKPVGESGTMGSVRVKERKKNQFVREEWLPSD